MIAFIFNGPPGIGKDTIVSEIVNASKTGFSHYEFKDELFRSASKIFNIDMMELKARNSNRLTKEEKVTQWKIPGTSFPEEGLSARDVLMYTSEKIVKPLLGKLYFGKAAAKNVLEENKKSLHENKKVFFSDGGFQAEIEAFLEQKIKTVVIRMHCDGMDFSNDSREYIKDVPGACFFDIDCPRGEVQETVKKVLNIVNRF